MAASRAEAERVIFDTFSARTKANPAAARSALTVSISLYSGATRLAGSRESFSPTTCSASPRAVPFLSPHTLNRNCPPGRSTRLASRKAAGLSGKKHHAELTHDIIEGAVGERQRHRVSLPPCDAFQSG